MALTLTLSRCPDGAAPETRRTAGADLTIGRNPDCEWVLADPDLVISKRHCVFEHTVQGWQVRDLSTNGTYLNHAAEPIGRDRAVTLASGDRVQLGAWEIKIEIEAEIDSVTNTLEHASAPDDVDPFAETPPMPDHRPPIADTSPPLADAGVAAFLAGAGLPANARAEMAPDEFLHQAGALLRASIAGLRDLLIARADVKREFRIEQTVMRSAGNSPLKFAPTEEAALRALLAAAGDTDVRETVRDLTAHQVATLAATQAAARALLDRLAPSAVAAGDPGGGLLPGSREKRLWEAYRTLHQTLSEQFDDDFDSTFGKQFARSYERATHETKMGDSQHDGAASRREADRRTRNG